MSENFTRRASLEELKKRREKGETFTRPDAPEGPEAGEELPEGFWEDAKLVYPEQRKSVHLKLDPDVFDYFFREARGRGHITKMQNVLKAYVKARKSS